MAVLNSYWEYSFPRNDEELNKLYILKKPILTFDKLPGDKNLSEMHVNIC